MVRTIAPLVAFAATFIAGCNQDATESTSSKGIAFVPGQGNAESLDAEQKDIAQLAINTLAIHLGIAKDRVLVDTIRAVEWPDSSVGCPQPDEAYLQVITPGHKITLRVDGQIHVVHEARGHAFVCVRAKAPGSVVTPQYELLFGDQLVFARRDLASRLGVTEDVIKAASAEEVTWPDASMGCPEPGQPYAQMAVSGWALKLRHGAREYTYHTDLTRTIPCPPITVD